MTRDPYAEVLDWLCRLEAARGMDFTLARVERTLAHLGHPQRRYPVLHVAGTNGKGSVAAMLDAMLAAAGYRTGLYTSPHLVHFGERIRVAGRDIPPEAVVALAGTVQAASRACGADLTFFEFVTVMAFVHFAAAAVDVAVVEVGLGGRLDATNVVEPEVAIITSIGRDHEAQLGNTLAAIAREKAGIIKAERPVVVGPVAPEPAAVIADVARERRAPAYWYGRDFTLGPAGGPARFDGCGTSLDGLEIGLRGDFQRANAATALAALATVRARLPVPPQALRRGLAAVRWPGRVEVVATRPLVVLDGAHNPDALASLVRALPDVVGGRRVHLLFAVMRDKPWEAMVSLLAPVAASVTTTEVQPPRGLEAEPLAAAFAEHCPARAVPDPDAALATVLAAAAPDDAVLVCGSLFLVGAVYPHFLRRRGAASPFDGVDAARPA